MIPIDVWRSVFRSAYSRPSPKSAVPLEIVGHYTRFFRGHHGPCRIHWGTNKVSWSFPECPHKSADDVCEVHQGFLLGLLDATSNRETKFTDDSVSRAGTCTLVISWTEA